MVLILDGNSEHVSHVWRNIKSLFGEKNPNFDSSWTNQMPLTDQITKYFLFSCFYSCSFVFRQVYLYVCLQTNFYIIFGQVNNESIEKNSTFKLLLFIYSNSQTMKVLDEKIYSNYLYNLINTFIYKIKNKQQKHC